MEFQLTNDKLAGLLKILGFQSGHLVKERFRLWQHPGSRCELLLPANKANDSPRPADLVGIKAQLDLHGHLDEEAFDLFTAEGRLPAASAGSD